MRQRESLLGRWLLAGVAPFVVAAGCSATGTARTSGTASVITSAPSQTVATSLPPTTSSPPTTTTTSTTTLPSLEQLYRTVESGVLRVQASTCSGSGIGTGFLVAADELVTAAHVVAGTVSLAVDTAGGPVAGFVQGIDPGLDIALIRLDRPVDGYVFSIAAETPAPGASVVAIGFPLDQPKGLTAGTVSGVERTVTYDDGVVVTHLIQTDVAVNPGNSGGPLLDAAGRVVGIVSGMFRGAEGIGYAATASLARPLVETWFANPQPVAATFCDGPLGPQEEETDVSPPITPDPIAAVAAQTFDAYFSGINSGNYEQARARQAPERRTDPEEWARSLSTTFDTNIVLQSVAATDEAVLAWVTFTSLQAPEKGPRPGETCTSWSIDYTLVPADDGLLWIADGEGHAGGPISQPCGD